MPRHKKNRSSQPAMAVPPDADNGGPRAWLVAVVLAISIGAVYGRALDAPLIFDDRTAINGNKSIISLWPLVGTTAHPGPLNPPRDLPTSSRPLVNLSLALNYHWGGLNPTGYHAVNVALHFGSALLLWAIVRRTLRLPYFAGRFATSAGWLALAVALLWALHPLQTEAVIYATQRTELMMALFYLATLYCSLRYWDIQGIGLRRAIWLLLAIIACLGGMASKEVMVSAPLMTLLFERTFVAGSLAKALRRSWPLYAGLAATWILLLVPHAGAHYSGSAGFGLGVPGYVWWLTQTKVLLMYLKLAIWPFPLLIHYEFPYLNAFAEAWMYVVPVLLLGIITLALLWRNLPVGYLGTWIFAILSPTCVVPIITEMAAERRMYLPLAALVVLFVIGAYRLAEWALRRRASGQRTLFGWQSPLATIGSPVLLLALVFGLVSAKRLAAYDDEMQLWQEVLQYQPNNYMAHTTMGLLLKNSGRLPDAIVEFQTARALKPDYSIAHNNLGIALTYAGRLPEAIEAHQAALALTPDYPDALNNLGLALVRIGRFSEAIVPLEHALKLAPEYVGAHENFGLALAGLGKVPQAIEQFRMVLQLGDNDANVHNDLGLLLVRTDRIQEAMAHFEQAAQLQPDRADIQNNLGVALRQTGRPQEAIAHFQAALRFKPDYVPAYENLAPTLAAANRSKEAIATAQKGIEVARNAGQAAATEKLEQWLKHYQIELQRDAAPAD